MKEIKFKDTEIGKIPEDWEATTIGKVCDVKRGVRVTREQLSDEGKYPVYQNTNYPMGHFDKYNVDANTPFVIVGGSAGLIGLCKERYWAADDCAYFGQSNKLDKVFLYYELAHRQWEIQRFVRTASVPRLDRKVIENFTSPIPPLSEQRRIASALTSIDNLIFSLSKLIEKKKNIKQGTMQQLLSGKIRLKGFDEPWVEHTIEELFDLGNGYTPSKSNPAYWTNGTIPWFRMEDIRTNGRILKDSIQHVTPEAVKGNGPYPKYSIILSTTANIGEHALLIADSLANQRFTFLNRKVNRRDMIDIIFFYHYCFILGKWCRDNINAGGLLAVNMEDLKNHSIYIPKSIAEQQAIATILTKMDNEIIALEAKKAKYEAIKQGMMQQLLTGKIRLIS